METASQRIKRAWKTRRKNGNDVPWNRLPIPEKRLLEEKYLLERKSTWQIANELNVSQTQIRRWLTYHKVPRRSYKENKMPVKKGSNHTWGKKIGKSMKGNVNSPKGEECWNWKGGVTPVRKMIRNSVKYKEWRTKVFERDNWTCQNCKKKGVYIEADHYPDPFCKICERNNIETLEDAMECKELWQISKGRTLCKKCHYKIGWSLFREENPHSNY